MNTNRFVVVPAALSLLCGGVRALEARRPFFESEQRARIGLERGGVVERGAAGSLLPGGGGGGDEVGVSF